MKNLHSNENYLGFEIFRERTNQSTSLQSTYFSYITIGYIISGSKHIYCNGKQTTIKANNIFILGIGTHYEALAEKANCSLTTFKKNFNLIFGVPPRKWITEQRLDRAKFLLQSTEQSISEIAYKCGFANVSHFTKLFKLSFGKTPKEFRR